MPRRTARTRVPPAPPRTPVDPFAAVRAAGLTLPGVAADTKYDGSPVLRLGGCFLAGLATHPSAEPDTIVVRANPDARAALLEDAPDTYYLTDHYARHPVVLARLPRLDDAALRDLLAVSRRLTLAKTRGGRARRP
jgi:hypothetical protein